ncbi:TRAP transporter substrate-binding protein [Plastorhodobacter daqingensis]|uniref:TRAP transporter substrate-binding protein n=1 Tax=Plastorhodobacter daqingensis TaxID=1387281 RepID=A0ABW2UPY1_9RHOB
MSKEIRKFCHGAAVAAMVGLTALSASAEVSLNVATVDAAGTLRNLAGNRLHTLLREQDAGVQVRHIEGPVLGNAAQVRDQVAEGSVDIIGTDIAWAAPYSNFLKATSFSFVFRDQEHLAGVLDSAMMAELIDEIAAEQGVRILGAAVLPSRAFFTKVTPQRAADFEGLKIRSPQLDNWLESYKAIGANPTPVNWNEVFLALQTGLVDGAHGLPVDVQPNNWHKAAPNVTDLEDMFGVHVWMINETRWSGMSSADQATLVAAIDEVDAWMTATAEAESLSTIASLLDQGGGVFITHNAAKREAVAALAGADKVVAFPEDEREAMRNKALAAGKALEGQATWWAPGVLDELQSVR